VISRRRALALLGAAGAEAVLVAHGVPLHLARAQAGGGPAFLAWIDRTLGEHTSLRDDARARGYNLSSLSIYGAPRAPLYAAVMTQPATPVSQHDYPAIPGGQFQATFDAEAAQGYGPVIIAASGPAANPTIAAVFEPQDPIPLTRIGLTSVLDTSDPAYPNGIQAMNAQARDQGLILRWAASYGTAANPAFAAIWVPNPSVTMWGNDSGAFPLGNDTIAVGLLDTAVTYQHLVDVQLAAWSRLAFVTLNADRRYFSWFVDTELAATWHARHDITASDLQSELDGLGQTGEIPTCIQGGGADQGSARFAAVFAASSSTVPRAFSAVGPVANAPIEAVIQRMMEQYGVRHAALAILRGTRLVYARGFTLAEPDWPQANAMTRFRLASVSKTPTALATFQLIEQGVIGMDDRVNDILQLTTPAGNPPTDPRFGAITVRHLIEHSSGIDPDAAFSGPDVQQAFRVAGVNRPLPVTAAMTDRYIASLPLVSAPGAEVVYNNAGYYLLGRVVAQLRGTSTLIAALESSLFGPLGISRIRDARSLQSAQQPNEARYQDFALQVGQSQLNNDQRLVPDVYGTLNLEVYEGGGGLSGAATDVARLGAVFLAPGDTPALKRQTLATLMRAAAQRAQAHPDWAVGYGLDAIAVNPNGSFYGQKGGYIDGTSTVLQFDGRAGGWGHVMLWANGRPGVAPDETWYPDLPEVMDIAKQVDWGHNDLFPMYGMASL